MDPGTIMLIKLLSDIIITATSTLKTVGDMTDEQVQQNIAIAEKTSDDLLTLVK
uniref:Uncharacterized protein n=1 Tax=viral metagenome TaxID=1070528 RepID=A0A6M3MBQ3_9ZZZZ